MTTNGFTYEVIKTAIIGLFNIQPAYPINVDNRHDIRYNFHPPKCLGILFRYIDRYLATKYKAIKEKTEYPCSIHIAEFVQPYINWKIYNNKITEACCF